MMTNELVIGSLAAIARQEGKSLAETFVNCDVVVIIDTSGSMANRDGSSLKSRYDVACDELRKLQGSLPGKIGLLAFSGEVQFCPSGIPTFFMGGTDMAKALKFAKLADVPDMRFILISDGQPDDEKKTLDVARTYQNRIDTIYIGPEGGSGQRFLQELSRISGGQQVRLDQAEELSQSVTMLLKG